MTKRRKSNYIRDAPNGMVNDYEEKQIVILVDQEWYLYQAILNDNKEEVFRILSEEKINVKNKIKILKE